MNLLNVPKIFPMLEIEKTGIEDFFNPLLENIILKIPVTVDGEEKLEERKVTEVGFVDAGLDDSDSWKRYLETVTIPASVTLPTSLETIDGSAFRGCSSLTGITFPEGLLTIGDESFMECTALTSMAYKKILKNKGVGKKVTIKK